MTLLFDTRNLFVRALKKLVRNPILIFFSLFQPIIFLVLFTQLFHSFNLLPGFPKGVSYLQFAAAGILLQNAFSSALQAGTSIVDDINYGFLSKMLVTQVSRPAILLGRLSSDALRVTVQSTIILVLAYILGFRVADWIAGHSSDAFHNCFLRTGLVWHLPHSGDENEELRDRVCYWRVSDLPPAICELCSRARQFHADMDAGRFHG